MSFSSFLFQFTHPVRGATEGAVERIGGLVVSIHAPREGCDLFCEDKLIVAVVSIHAPREGCDQYEAFLELKALWFQFTHPVRGATPVPQVIGFGVEVSIHAPREGCDS